MVKMAYLYGVSPVSLLLLRMLFALPFYILVAFTKRPESKPATRDIGWVIFLGLIGYYLASFFDFLGLQYVKAGLERLILFVYPTLVLLISRVFLKVRISGKQLMGVLITYFGILVIFSAELQINADEGLVLGVVLILLSALTYAGYIVGSGWIIPTFGARVFTSYAMIVSCVAFIGHYLLAGDYEVLNQPAEVYWIGLAMAVFATVIPSYLISYAIQRIGANNFAILGSLGPISTVLLAYLFLDEVLTPVQLAGGLVIILGIVLAEKKKK